jgi:hypothetical protein
LTLRHVKLFLDPEFKRELKSAEDLGSVEIIDGVPVSKQVKVYAVNGFYDKVGLTLEAVGADGLVDITPKEQTVGAKEAAEFTVEMHGDPTQDRALRFQLRATESYTVVA